MNELTVKKTDNGIVYWDVMYGSALISRFDYKWQAVEFVKENQHILTMH